MIRSMERTSVTGHVQPIARLQKNEFQYWKRDLIIS